VQRELQRLLQQDAQDALENLRDLARGIYPSLLADQGLPAALEAQARKVPMPVSVETDGIGRYPQEFEAAVYFCVLEALQNASKYAGASEISVRVSRDDGDLVFAVADDGRGFDRRTTPPGTGLRNMADRLAAEAALLISGLDQGMEPPSSVESQLRRLSRNRGVKTLSRRLGSRKKLLTP
jgi:signal transduction histidine kinase